MSWPLAPEIRTLTVVLPLLSMYELFILSSRDVPFIAVLGSSFFIFFLSFNPRNSFSPINKERYFQYTIFFFFFYFLFCKDTWNVYNSNDNPVFSQPKVVQIIFLKIQTHWNQNLIKSFWGLFVRGFDNIFAVEISFIFSTHCGLV